MGSLISRKDAALRLGISLVTLDEERTAGRLSYIQRAPGCKVFLRESDLDDWLARNTHQARPVQLSNRPTYRKVRAK